MLLKKQLLRREARSVDTSNLILEYVLFRAISYFILPLLDDEVVLKCSKEKFESFFWTIDQDEIGFVHTVHWFLLERSENLHSLGKVTNAKSLN